MCCNHHSMITNTLILTPKRFFLQFIYSCMTNVPSYRAVHNPFKSSASSSSWTSFLLCLIPPYCCLNHFIACLEKRTWYHEASCIWSYFHECSEMNALNVGLGHWPNNLLFAHHFDSCRLPSERMGSVVRVWPPLHSGTPEKIPQNNTTRNERRRILSCSQRDTTMRRPGLPA